jgi:membrane associated rhomboid family serine protease
MNDLSPSAFPRPREPMFAIPMVVVILVGVLLSIHALITYLPAESSDVIYIDWGFIPGRLTIALWPDQLAKLIARSNVDPDALAQARLWRDTAADHGGAKLWTLATYSLLHVSWMHVGMNSVWLVAFGPPIARRFGAPRFLMFFVATAIAGALAHWAVASMDFAPLIGASAADSGLMAAAARFIFQPGAPLGGGMGYSASAAGSESAPAATLRQLLTDRRALVFIGIWMVTNFVFGAGAQSLGATQGPVAWIAHVGGFVAGLVLFPLFDRGAGKAPTGARFR